MNKNSKIYVAGNTGLVGSSLARTLNQNGYQNIISISSKDCDLRNQERVDDFFKLNKPEYVFLAAAKVGGIKANFDNPADFIRDNLQIQTNVIDAAYRHGVTKLLFLGSSCIYPKFPSLPITEDQLLTGPLEQSNDSYAIAKIAGIKMCQAYKKQYGFDAISIMPTNLYGPNDNFDLETSHVFPALIRRFHEAAKNNDEYVECWGTGTPMREFLYVDDLADACIHLMKYYSSSDIVNIGTGTDITIKELTTKIANVIGYNGKIIWDTNKPDGTPRKVLNIDKIKSLGWQPKVGLLEGINRTYEWYKKNVVI